MMKRGQFRIRAAAAVMSAAIALGTPVLSLTALAATGTVTGDAINVRSDASTSSSIVGTANAGDVLDVGDSKDDDSGNTWYQVTLSDGSTGYIRNDFINVTEDEPEETPEEADTEEEETPEETDTSSAGVTQTGDYQVVQAPDDDDNLVYYLYNNVAGERMKISDIEALQSRVTEAEKNAANAGNRYRIVIVALAVLLVLALAGCVTLFLRLRDAMTNGHRERDLTRDRANERRRGGGADDLTAVKRRTREDRRDAASFRSNAYASGTRRRPASGDARSARDDRQGEDYSRVRSDARPARTGNDASRETTRRPVSDERRAASADSRRERPVRSERSSRPVGDEDVRTARPRSERPVRNDSAEDTAGTQRTGASQNTSAMRTSRSQARNFADDDDLDYGFISLDDK